MNAFHESSHQSPVFIPYIFIPSNILSPSYLFDFVALRVLDYPEGNSVLGSPRRKWKDNSKSILKKLLEVVVWIHLAQGGY